MAEEDLFTEEGMEGDVMMEIGWEWCKEWVMSQECRWPVETRRVKEIESLLEPSEGTSTATILILVPWK